MINYTMMSAIENIADPRADKDDDTHTSAAAATRNQHYSYEAKTNFIGWKIFIALWLVVYTWSVVLDYIKFVAQNNRNTEILQFDSRIFVGASPTTVEKILEPPGYMPSGVR